MATILNYGTHDDNDSDDDDHFEYNYDCAAHSTNYLGFVSAVWLHRIFCEYPIIGLISAPAG